MAKNSAQIPPFSPQTPWLSDGVLVAWPHTQLLIALQRAAVAAPQIGAIPANSSAAGNAGALAFDANFLYICVAANQWRRVALGSF